MRTLTIKAPAKINLYLEISSRRPDGYHNIESVMQTVSLFDTLTFTLRTPDGRAITIECDNPQVPIDESNLVYRAATLFFDKIGTDIRDVSISIEKKIPMAGGLAGGSSDAAATLVALNELYGAELSLDELCALGVRIGADVPFCLRQGICSASGIGDILLPCDPLPDCFIVIARKGEEVSTPWAYRLLDETYDFDARSIYMDDFLETLSSADLDRIVSQMTNIFESVVIPKRPAAREIRDVLYHCGALGSMMSGSGPSVFGIFTDEKKAKAAVQALEMQNVPAYLTKPYYPAN